MKYDVKKYLGLWYVIEKRTMNYLACFKSFSIAVEICSIFNKGKGDISHG